MERDEIFTEVIRQFEVSGTLKDCASYGSGHINDTYRLIFESCGAEKAYILQRINKRVFRQPTELMENICGVTEWLCKKIRDDGGDVQRETLNLVRTHDGKFYYMDSFGEYWRIYLFIKDAACFDQVEKEEDFYQSALAFGRFQNLLADYPAHTLHETIKDFHNTPERFRRFQKALEEDAFGRAAGVEKEIRFILEREELTRVLWDLQESGKLPLRVTHNDTKLNNVLFDRKTGRAVCVIDLDTVMPGLSVNDFGDSIRFGANTAAEDEKDLSKVSCDMHLYRLYARGYIEGCRGALTELEKEMLPMGAILMTLETGIRFLTDYLEGDHYFKIHREGHNLDRARTQLAMVKDMEKKLPQMKAAITGCR